MLLQHWRRVLRAWRECVLPRKHAPPLLHERVLRVPRRQARVRRARRRRRRRRGRRVRPPHLPRLRICDNRPGMIDHHSGSIGRS